MLNRLADLAAARPRRLLALTAAFFVVAARAPGLLGGGGRDIEEPDAETVRSGSGSSGPPVPRTRSA